MRNRYLTKKASVFACKRELNPKTMDYAIHACYISVLEHTAYLRNFVQMCLQSGVKYTPQNNQRTKILECEYNKLKHLNSVKLGPKFSILYVHKSRIIITDFHA